MASRRMKIKTMAKLPVRPRPGGDRPKTPSLLSPSPYGEPPSPSTSLTSPSIPPPPSSPKPSSYIPSCPPSPKPPVVYHIYPPPSPNKYNVSQYDDGSGVTNVLAVSSAGLLSPRTPQSHHNTPVASPLPMSMPPSPASSYHHTGAISPRRPTTPKTPSFLDPYERENSQDNFFNPPSYLSSYSALSPGMGPGIPSRAPPSVSPGPSTSNPSSAYEDINSAGKSAFASASRPFSNLTGTSSSSHNILHDVMKSPTKGKTMKYESGSSSNLPSLPSHTTNTPGSTNISSSPSKSSINSTNPSITTLAIPNATNKGVGGTTKDIQPTHHHHHHHHHPHLANAPNNTDTLRQRLQKGTIAPSTSKYAMIRKDYLTKYQNASPNPKDLTILHYAFFNPPKAEKPPEESIDDEDEIFSTDKDKTSDNQPAKRKSTSSIETTVPSTTTKSNATKSSQPQPTSSSSTPDSRLKEINETEKKQSIAPKVKVGPDGQLIIDEQSLVIETTESKRAKEQLAQMETVSGANYVVGSSGIYYRKKPFKRGTDWNEKETLRFYRALISCGTDFSMMETVFKHRTRAELKAKFKREDRRNPEQVSRALKKQVFDPTFALTDSEDEKEQEEQTEQIIGKGKRTSKKKKASASADKEEGDITDKANEEGKSSRKRKIGKKSAAIAPPVKDFLIKNPKTGKIDWDLSHSVEEKQNDTSNQLQGGQQNINSTTCLAENRDNNVPVEVVIETSSIKSVEKLPQPTFMLVDHNADNNSHNSSADTAITVTPTETVAPSCTTVDNNVKKPRKRAQAPRRRSSTSKESAPKSVKKEKAKKICTLMPQDKPKRTGRKKAAEASPNNNDSEKEKAKEISTSTPQEKPKRKRTKKSTETSNSIGNRKTKKLPDILRFDSADPLGLKIVKEYSTNLSMPSLERETTTMTLAAVPSDELKSTSKTDFVSDTIASDASSGKSYITLKPAVKLKRTTTRRNSVAAKSESAFIDTQKVTDSLEVSSTIVEAMPVSVKEINTETEVIATTSENPSTTANKRASLRRKGTPYRLPGPGPGTFPAPPTTLVEEIEIEITCK